MAAAPRYQRVSYRVSRESHQPSCHLRQFTTAPRRSWRCSPGSYSSIVSASRLQLFITHYSYSHYCSYGYYCTYTFANVPQRAALTKGAMPHIRRKDVLDLCRCCQHLGGLHVIERIHPVCIYTFVMQERASGVCIQTCTHIHTNIRTYIHTYIQM